jgi:hypothetical protein
VQHGGGHDDAVPRLARQLGLTPQLPGAAAQPIAANTNEQGQFTLVIPAGPSRTLALTYAGAAHLQPARRQLNALTRGKVTLTVRPRSIREPASVRLTGRVYGTPLPPGGKLVTLEALVGHRWQPFATVHTDATGRFGYVERFRRSPPGVYRLRASLPREAAFAYTAAHSRPARVRVH